MDIYVIVLAWRIFDFRVIIVLFLVYYLMHYISLFLLNPINLPDSLPRMLFENSKINQKKCWGVGCMLSRGAMHQVLAQVNLHKSRTTEYGDINANCQLQKTWHLWEAKVSLLIIPWHCPLRFTEIYFALNKHHCAFPRQTAWLCFSYCF